MKHELIRQKANHNTIEQHLNLKDNVEPNVIKLSIGHPSTPLRAKMRYLPVERSRSLFKVKFAKFLLT